MKMHLPRTPDGSIDKPLIFMIATPWVGVAACAAIGIANPHLSRDIYKREIGVQVRRDGFTTERGAPDGIGGSPSVIGSLVLGNCTFHDVKVKVTRDKDGHALDITSYNAAISQQVTTNIVGIHGETETDTQDLLTLQFTNADMLQKELPNLHCNV